MVAGNREHRRAEGPEQYRRSLELVATAAMREVAGRDDELRLGSLDEPCEREFCLPLLMCTRV